MSNPLNESSNSQSDELQNLSAENARLRNECNEAATLLARRELELAECKYHLKAMASMYESICSSIIWERTAPIRRILDKVNKSVRRFRTTARSVRQPAGENLAGTDTRLPERVSSRVTEVTVSPGIKLNILYVYKVASFGGVERVLLNRAEAFKRHNIGCRLSVYFYEDEGALERIHDYIAQHDFGAHLRIVSKINAADYDYVISIDTPEVLAVGIPQEKLLFECHTTYYNSQRYLARLPDAIRLIAVPSAAAKLDIAERFPQLRHKLIVLRNFIPAHNSCIVTKSADWNKRPLLYLGRMDEHKNFTEVLDIFQQYRECYGDEMFLLLVGPVFSKIDLPTELSKRNINDCTVVMPPVSFDRVWHVYAQVRQHKGIFISASQAESFGLAAAEALNAGLPVLLSGIAPHIDLVAGSLDYVYPLGDAVAGARKLRGVVENYGRAVSDAEVFGQQFLEDNFLSDWQSFTALLQLQRDL